MDINLKKELHNNEWIFISPDNESPIQINNFDDGNEKYEDCDNNWIVYGTYRGKIALYNLNKKNIIIKSISTWKTSK